MGNPSFQSTMFSLYTYYNAISYFCCGTFNELAQSIHFLDWQKFQMEAKDVQIAHLENEVVRSVINK